MTIPCEQKDRIERIDRNVGILVAHHNYENGKRDERKQFWASIIKIVGVIGTLISLVIFLKSNL